MRRCLAAAVALLLAPPAWAEGAPWVDYDGLGTPERHQFGETGVQLGAEYRANWMYVNPIDINGVKHRRASWIEHRLRLDSTIDYEEKVRLVTSFEILDGTLWGDNGSFGATPSTNSGTRAAAKSPNNTRPVVGYIGGDELDSDSYGYVLAPADPVKVRHLYGEVVTPVGMLRIGRQPSADGTTILVSDGEGRGNRFGFSGSGDTSDRILFATKPLEGFKPEAERDTSRERGVFLIGFYDRAASERIGLFGDDLNAAGAVVRYLAPEPRQRTHLELQGIYAHRWETEFDTNIHINQLRGILRADKLTVGAEGVYISGRTREVSAALSLINADPVVRQRVAQWGARAVARWDEPAWTAYLELDFASGDRNPNPGTQLTQLYFAQDANVGLLMFERILAFESARSSAVGVELLRRVGATTFPAERVDSRGSFTNAIAVFPQADVRPTDNLLLRGGVLAAWTPTGLVDSIQTLANRDGVNVEDDLVNYHGGKPGKFYGVELDGRVRWSFLDRFLFDLEGAILFPGDAFHDENQQAVRSVLVQGRTTFVF